MDPGRYRDDPEHRARLNKRGLPEPTRQPRYGNRLYCMVWADHDLFKLGLGSGKNARDASALRSISKYFEGQGTVPGSFKAWRAELPALEGAAWGDCQRLEMVVATAVKRRLGASPAGAVGLEWFTRNSLDQVSWTDELTAATIEALVFSGLDPKIEWAEYTPRRARASASPDPRNHGPSQRDSWRTMRNQRSECALKGCRAAVTDQAIRRDGFVYCSESHATVDRDQRRAERQAG